MQDPRQPETHAGAEARVLESLEADLVAVEEAMATLDRIAAEGVGGASASAQISAVVSPERFPLDDEERLDRDEHLLSDPATGPSELIGDRLGNQEVDPGSEHPSAVDPLEPPTP